MILTYKFNSTSNLTGVLNLCKTSKDLYNQANYIVRNKFIETYRLKKEGKTDKVIYLDNYKLDKIMKNVTNLEGEINYKKLKAQTSQQILKVLNNNWKSYFVSIRDWGKNKLKYKGMPKLPGYKKKDYDNLYFTNQNCQIKRNQLILSKDIKIEIPEYKKFKPKNLMQVRILPKNGYYEVEIVYRRNRKLADVSKNNIASIDLGLDNLATMVTTNSNSYIFDGKKIKSLNQWYNKSKKKLQQINDFQKNKYTKNLRRLDTKRNSQVKDYLHKTSKKIVDILVENKIGKLIIGHNGGWKSDINLGNKTNQNFVSIPHTKLIQLLVYKCNYVGIKVKVVNEHHTSKCDSLALEGIHHHKNYKGKRTKRGLFQSSKGKVLNADINGAINILRLGNKSKGNSLVKEIADRGLLFNPIRLKIDNSSKLLNSISSNK